MQQRTTWLWVALGGAVVTWWMYANRDQTASAIQTGVEDVTAALAGWKQVGQGPVWVPVLNAAEQQFGIPPDLLARMAYQESRFRQDVIDGSYANPSSGALGIMQMLPKYFSTVNAQIPYSAADTTAQIQQAAAQLDALYNHFRDWGLAVAAYNDGQTNIDNYIAGTHALPDETVNYVADVLADVPVSAATIPA